MKWKLLFRVQGLGFKILARPSGRTAGIGSFLRRLPRLGRCSRLS